MMTDNRTQQSISTENDDNGIDLLEILITISNHKLKFIFIPIICGIIGYSVSLMLPNVYRANIKLLPPQQSQSSASAMLNQLSGLAGGAGAALGIKNPNDLYIALLRSRTLTDKLIQKFDLKKRYNQQFLENARTQLEARTFINSGKENIISIDFEDNDPKIAAQIANGYAEELATLTSKFALTEASQRRVFYEKQLELTKNRMIAAENTLAKSIPNSGLMSVDTQSKAILETTAKLRANISAKEIHLKALQTFVTPNSFQYKGAYQELNVMKAELLKLESGTNGNELSKTEEKSENIIEDKKLSNFGTKNFQLLRDVKYQQMLYEMLAKQYEIARIDEAKDLPLIQILDQATEPENKFKPKRSIISIISFLTGLAFTLIAILIIEKIKKNPSIKTRKKIDKLKISLTTFK